MLSQSDISADIPAEPISDDRSLRLPVHATTMIAEDLRVRLVMASDFDGEICVDASEVESIGQAVLQLLIAAKVEADAGGQSFTLINPSPAFVARVTSCGLENAIGLIGEEELPS